MHALTRPRQAPAGGRPMNDIAVPEPIRACVTVGLGDAPEHVAGLAVALQRHLPFRVTVVVYTPRLLLAPFPLFVGPTGGLGVGAAIAEDREADRAQEQLHNIEQAMQLAFPENQKTEVTCATGSPYRLAARLCEASDLLVMPHRLGAVGVLRRWWPGPYLRLAFASHAPTLFCVGLPPWERVIIVDSSDRASWLARRVLLHFSDRLGFSLGVVHPEAFASGGGREYKQDTCCLVVSLAAVRRTFRGKVLSSSLRDWTGACLLWP